LLWTNSNLIPA